jgi:hypothetical protein
MTWIYLLELIPKKMKSKPPRPFPIFYGHYTDNSRDSHCALSEEEEGGYSVQLLIYTHSSDGHCDVNTLVAIDE